MTVEDGGGLYTLSLSLACLLAAGECAAAAAGVVWPYK